MAVPVIIAAAALSAYSAYSQGQTQAANQKSQASASRYNAQVAANNAQQTAWETSDQQEAFQRRYRAQRGEQVAAIAQSGIGFDGTGNDLIHQSDINASLDNLTIRYQGDLKQKGLLSESDMDTYQAGVYDANAKQSKTAGYLGAAGALLNGASSYSKYQSQYGGSGGGATTSNGPLPWLSSQSSYGPYGG